jgi:wyosine [tRNA(Phe)-imidazoG37] synthetase (radical SAM superfamily)
MSEASAPLAFGPVPSRRLGHSLGIGNVPPKTCSYSCVYCQVGRTPSEEIVPREFWPPQEVVAAVSRRVQALRERGEPIDALTFVPDGEPTLDRHLGEEIEGLRPLGLRIAVISNGSLVWRPEVREALARADWVSLKVDAVDESVWRAVNRGHSALRLDVVLDGMLRFAAAFGGELATETMLVEGLNDGETSIDATAAFLERLRPKVAYVAVPTRPPAEPWVRPAGGEAVNRAYQRFAERLPRVELLTEFEGTAFGTSGDPVADLLAITTVHPMREDAALALFERAGAGRAGLERLLDEGRLEKVPYRGHLFYVRPSRSEATGRRPASNP